MDLDALKACLTQSVFQDTLSAKAKRSWLTGQGRCKLRSLTDNGEGHLAKTVLVRSGEDSDNDSASRPRHPSPFRQRSVPIGHMHKTKATENDITGSVRQFQILAIHDPSLEVSEMPLLRGLLGERDKFFG